MVTSLQEARWMAWILADRACSNSPHVALYSLAANALRNLCDLIEDAEWTSSPYTDGEICPFCGAGGLSYMDGRHDEEHYEDCVFRHDRPSGQKQEP